MTILACDLGGTRMKIGIVRAGRVLASTVEPAHGRLGLAPQLPALAAGWRRLLAEANLEPADCAGITVAFPSLVDPASGRVLSHQGKYADAPGIDLRAWAGDEFGLPLAIENDARMALIGEWQAGAGLGCDNLVMVTLGTGLGVCAVIEGRVLRGRHGQAGVLGGHLTVRVGGRRCGCGNVGCAEAEASTSVLGEIAATLPGLADSALAQVAPLDYAAVFRLAAEGDACAVALRAHSLQVWSALVVNLIHAFDPERVVLGGGIMASGEVILPAVRDYVARHAHTPWGHVAILPSKLGSEAALVAGEWLLRNLVGRAEEFSR